MPSDFGEAQVLATNSSVVVKVQHEVGGAATVEVVLDERPADLTLVHEGTMSLASGEVLVTHAGREQDRLGQIAPASTRPEYGWTSSPIHVASSLR